MVILGPALLWAAFALPARAQVDPDRHRLLQIGYDQPTVGPAPPGGYIFFYSNEPRFIRPNWTLRTALAPTYADNELGLHNVLGTRNDLGIGLAGGGFSDDYYEVRQGHYFPEESFTGDGASTYLALYRTLNPGQRYDISAQAGGSTNADRLDAYRLGGLLPFASEFPLSLPGYYNGELSAQRYVLLGGQYGVPLDAQKLFEGRLFADAANVTYLPGLGQSKPWNEGVGTGVDINIPGNVWNIIVNYAYGVDAIRSGHRGAHSIRLLTQVDFEAARKRITGRTAPPATKPEGTGWLLRLFGW